MAAAPLAGVAVGKLAAVAVSAPACSVVVPGSWLLELAPGTFPFVSVLTSQMLSEKATSAVPAATNPPSLVSPTDPKLLKWEAGRKTCCQDSAPAQGNPGGQQPPEGGWSGMAEDLVENAGAVREDRVLGSWRSVVFAPVGMVSGAAAGATRCAWAPPSSRWGAACC